MDDIILLSCKENTAQVEAEEQSRFVRTVLETFIDKLPTPISNLWDENEHLSVENKIKLRSILSEYSIQIIDDGGGGLQVYCEDVKIGEWKKCEYTLKKDLM